jgi:hypothetical protein
MVFHRGVVGRGTFPAALASEESILLADADLMLSLESLGLQIVSAWIVRDRAFSDGSAQAAGAVPASARAQLKLETADGRTTAENKSGHPLGAGWPFRAGDRQSLCRKGTSAETRTGAGGPHFDGQGARRLEPVIAWWEGHDALSGSLVREISCEVARLYQ